MVNGKVRLSVELEDGRELCEVSQLAELSSIQPDDFTFKMLAEMCCHELESSVARF